jgi:DNA-binding NarL/FixJ family response regulator
MKIFVIDDEAFQREMVADFISRKFPQAEVHQYATGEQALHEIFKKPDCVILDYYLNLQDPAAANGIEILEQFREVLPQTPVILLSGQDNPEIAAAAIKHGAYDYVVKNENSISRIQLLLDKIYGLQELQGKLGFQRVMNLVLLLLFVAMVIGVIVTMFF